MDGIGFEAADRLGAEALAALWTDAYAGYFVPLAFTPAMLAAHVRRSGLDLSRSLVGRVDGEPFGLSLAGFRGQVAWIGGFGVVAARRRQGLAGRLMAEHLGRLDAAGAAETRLEVIVQNPAREVYRAAGFAETRRLTSWTGAPRRGAPVALGELSVAELAEAHGRLHASPPAWRRGLPTLRADLADGAAALGVRRDGRVRAYAVAAPTPDRLNLSDAAAEDVAAAAALLAGLAARWPGLPLRLIDEPAGTPLGQALRAAGLEVLLEQAEMARQAGG